MVVSYKFYVSFLVVQGRKKNRIESISSICMLQQVDRLKFSRSIIGLGCSSYTLPEPGFHVKYFNEFYSYTNRSTVYILYRLCFHIVMKPHTQKKLWLIDTVFYKRYNNNSYFSNSEVELIGFITTQTSKSKLLIKCRQVARNNCFKTFMTLANSLKYPSLRD